MTGTPSMPWEAMLMGAGGVLVSGALITVVLTKMGEPIGDAIWSGALVVGGIVLLCVVVACLGLASSAWRWWGDRRVMRRRSDVSLVADSLNVDPAAVTPDEVRAWLAARKQGLVEDDVRLWATRGLPFTLAAQARRAGIALAAVDAAVIALKDGGIWSETTPTPRRIAAAFTHYEAGSFRDWTAFAPEAVTEAVRRQVADIGKHTFERLAWALDRAHQELAGLEPMEPELMTYPYRWARGLEVLPNGTLRQFRGGRGATKWASISLPECVSMTGGIDLGGTNGGYVELIDHTGQQLAFDPEEVATPAFRRALRHFCPVADVPDPGTGFTPLQLVDGPAGRVDIRVSMISIERFGISFAGNMMVIDNRPGADTQTGPDPDSAG